MSPTEVEDAGEGSSGPTKEQLQKELQRLQAEFDRGVREYGALEKLNAACADENSLLRERNKAKLKLNPPERFDGTASKLRGFLVQARAYHMFHKDLMTTAPQKVLNTGSYLTGPALVWYEPILKDYLDNKTDQQNDETVEIFQKYSAFEEHLTGMFGNKDEVRNAEQQIENLKQRKSASHYATEFRQLVARTSWDDDDQLMSRFYQGLKDSVKDEIAKEDRPETLTKYIERAIRIDDRNYAREQEKRNGNRTWIPRNGNRPNQGKSRQPIDTSYGT